ncbi:MAG: glucodextranase DOMON-like domain-containing protein [bacterium]
MRLGFRALTGFLVVAGLCAAPGASPVLAAPAALSAGAPLAAPADPTLIAIDEAAPESDLSHNSDAGADLTRMYAWLEGPSLDTLVVALDFASTWDGMHLVVALEKKRDASGSSSDPFEFPVQYDHALKPDYVFTYKYSGADYADLRRWSGGWEFWHLAYRAWTTNAEDPGKNALGLVVKTDSQVRFRFPTAAIGAVAAGDTLRFEAYVTQESPGPIKYTALDSSPHDATHDMTPSSGQWWETATLTMHLANYAVLAVPPIGVPPALTNPSAFPATIYPGDPVLFAVHVASAGGGIGMVEADLSAIGGSPSAELRDDGTGGDAQAGDGTYSTQYTVPVGTAGGSYTVIFHARDASNLAKRAASTTLSVTSTGVAFRSSGDPTGDDHGPAVTDGSGSPVSGLYYLYPTNSVFKQGAFDLERADFIVDGDFLIIRVKVRDVLSNAEVSWGAPNPGATCADPNKAQLNLPTIDVYIDAVEGEGATAGFPGRYIDIAQQDAWEYGLVADGWWKGLVKSNGQNSSSAWTLLKQNSTIDLCNDHVDNTVDIKVALSALGSPTWLDMARWDVVIGIDGHDGTSSDQNLGSLRPVNAGSPAEWQFGGGSNAVGGRNPDASVIDLLLAPGRWKVGGRSQQDMLNYKLPDAQARFNASPPQTACLIEATSGYSGVISGTITLNDIVPDLTTVVTVDVYRDRVLHASMLSEPGGGDYRIEGLPNGTYDLEARAPVYGKGKRQGVVVAAGGETSGMDFSLRKVPGAILGSVAVDGPASDVIVYAEDPLTGELAGDGADTIPGGTGDFEILTVEDGSYSLVARGRGYAALRQAVTIARDTTQVELVLSKAMATRYAFIDSLGQDIYSRTISRSLPDREPPLLDWAELLFQPRDDEGNIAVFDASALDSVSLRATLLDPAAPARGEVVFADSAGAAIPGNVITSEMFTDGVGRFFVRDDSVEVLRVEVVKGSRSGVVEVGVGELKPFRVTLASQLDTMQVGEAVKDTVVVQLVDASGNQSPTPDVAVRLKATGGAPIFEPELGITDANGRYTALVYAFKSGEATFTAVVEPGPFAGLPSETASVVFTPGPARDITASIWPSYLAKDGEGAVGFQIVDAYGNPVDSAGTRIDLAASPAELVAALETPVYTDGSGAASSGVRAGARFGIGMIEGSAAYPVQSVRIAVDSRVAANDEAAPESDPAHNSDANVDLTSMLAYLAGDTLKVALDFASSWEGVHLMVALETKEDAAGGAQDPFQFPIFYSHLDRPDYVFTYKYTANDYADLRRSSGAGWEFWQLAQAAWIIDDQDPGKNAVGMVAKTTDQVVFAFPLAAIGGAGPGDTLRLEAYVTQEFGAKYNALDSSPHDSTHDMVPDAGNWYETATDSVYLTQYAVYVLPQGGAAPGLSDAAIDPSTASPGDELAIAVTVENQGGGVGDVLADLGSLGGDSATRLNNAGGGIYTCRHTLPAGVAQGIQTVWILARDSLNISEATTSASVNVVNPPEVIASVEDSLGDDHGPNLYDASGNALEGRYYVYPTNGVFDRGVPLVDPPAPRPVSYIKGVFDIQSVELTIDGSFLNIRVRVSLPSSEAVGWNAPYPGETCANPNKADLNLQKIDIYIDSKEGAGATAGLPNRYVDIARSDAWEYAAVSEGWWKGLVESNGENSTSLWTIWRQSNQIDFCDDHLADYVDVRIGLAALGNPTAEDIAGWDFIVAMSGHDGDSNDQNFGATRWVNSASSEWQFGGGRDGEANRERDANIIDVVTVPGVGKVPGRTQEVMLDYLQQDAERRFEAGKVACILEATFSRDVSPPLVEPFLTDGFAHAVWYVLRHSPAAFWTKVYDESDVDSVSFRWRPLGESVWRITEMVNIVGEHWVADIHPDTLRQTLSTIELVDGTMGRAFEAVIRARDQYANVFETSLITFAVPDEDLDYAVAAGVAPGDTAVLYDGTVVVAPAADAAEFDTYDFKVTPLAEAGPDGVDLEALRSSMTYLGVARKLEITGRLGEDSSAVTSLATPITLALHYPTYQDREVGDELKIGIFEYNDVTARWIGIFGAANARGNAVTSQVSRAGTYALFFDRALGYDPGVGLSGVRAEPNPFSPNGDGLYDETRVTFFLEREADWVTIEIYDIAGEPVRTIRWQLGLTATGRNSFDIIWDGTDDRGNVVPYGIYILRTEVRFKIAPNNERQNIAVVVVK